MNLITKYILKKYLLNFFIVLASLEVFFVGIDFLQNVKSLPDSANLQFLYILYVSFFTLTLALPLSLVFAWVITLAIFVKNNELIAFHALGARRPSIYKPVVLISMLFLLVLILLQATPLAYSYDQKSRILDNKYFTSVKKDIFLKYNDNYIYFEKLFPLQKKATGIRIYKTNKKDLLQVITAKKAYFQNDKWYVIDAVIILKPKKIKSIKSKIIIKHEKFLHTLEGFKPKILDNVYERKSNFSITDAISALVLLKEQGINTNKIRAMLYNQVISSFFIIPVLFLIYIYSVVNSRFFNIGKFTSVSIFSTLIIWGIFFMLFKFTIGGTVSPEITMLLPISIWIIASIILYARKIKS